MADDAGRLEALKGERDRYVSLAFAWADLLLELDRDFNIRYIAGATQAFFGKKSAELLGSAFRDLVAPPDAPLIGQMLKQTQKAGRLDDAVIRIAGVGGAQFWVSIAAYCLDPVNGLIYVGLRRSSPKVVAALSDAKDGGLADASSFSALAAEKMKALAAAGESAEVTLVSIPGMTDLTGRLDSDAAQKLMQGVGDVLKASSVGGDTAARVGDNQFSVMHSAGTNVQDMLKSIEVMTQQFDPSGLGAKVEAATMQMDASSGSVSEEDLAKGLLYTLNKFRDSEGEGISVKDMASNMSSMITQAMDEVSRFRTVVSQAQFFVALQPIININTGEIHHYEALCRFDRAAGESPFKTITFAEETGLIHDFDYAMARKVMEWLSKFPRNNDKYRVAVNVSGFSIGKESYVDSLMKMLKENEWTQGKLMFEITESSRMSDLDGANKFIHALRDRGYHVCLDDFGAGAASFQYLSVLDVDVVKLDGSAIKNAQKAAKGRAFLSALTELCRRMKVETIAEMVDSKDALDFCRDCGCDYVQGFLFGKPSPEVKDFNPLPQGDLFKRSYVRL
ncbi:MAG TPA: EAL domain-containing protein [Magnetospirillaceae bacterium]